MSDAGSREFPEELPPSRPSGTGEHAGGVGYALAISLVAALGGFLFGFDSGVINGAVTAIRTEFGAGVAETGFAVSSVLVGCAVGAFFAGTLSDRFGRRSLLVAAAVLILVSAAGCGLARSAAAFTLFRVIGGLGVGAASVITPSYISEIAPARLRGRLASLQQLAIVCGLFFAFLSNYAIARAAGGAEQQWWLGYAAWRWMFWVALAPSAALLLGGFLIPESPRYLVATGRLQEATRIFARLGEPDPAAETARVLASLHERTRPRLRDLVQPGVRRLHPAVWLGAGMAAFQQFVGINVIFYYGEVLWRQAGFSAERALFTNVLSGSVNIAATLIAMSLIDRLGRRPLLLIGSAGMTLTLGVLAWVFLAAAGAEPGRTLPLSRDSALLAIVAAHLYILFFALSWGPVLWVMLPELYSNRIRGAGVGVASSVNWLSNFAVTFTFPILLLATGLGGAYLLYALAAAVSLAFVYFLIPETRGRELESI